MREKSSPSFEPQLVLDQVFEDMDSYAEALGGWDFDFRQLDAGPLQARATIIAGPRSTVARVEIDRKFHQVGGPPPGVLAFGLPETGFPFCGADAGVGDVINFNRRDGFEGCSPAEFLGHALMFQPELLDEVASDLGLELNTGELATRAAWVGQPAEIDLLRQRVSAVCLRARHGQIDAAEAMVLLSYEAAAIVVRAMGQGGKRQLDRTRRRKAVRSALEILEDELRLPLKVADLCRALGVSAPTLYRAFDEEFGVSPKQYIQARSLAGVQRDLLNAVQGIKVADVANRWGFWHMGDFASDYRRQFRELPSETLSHSPGASPDSASRSGSAR